MFFAVQSRTDVIKDEEKMKPQQNINENSEDNIILQILIWGTTSPTTISTKQTCIKEFSVYKMP